MEAKMAVTKSFKELVQRRGSQDGAFAENLLREGIDTMLTGDVETGKAILRDYIKATVGFEKLGEATDTPAKSLIRMFSPRGNPQARNLFGVISYLQSKPARTACNAAATVNRLENCNVAEYKDLEKLVARLQKAQAELESYWRLASVLCGGATRLCKLPTAPPSKYRSKTSARRDGAQDFRSRHKESHQHLRDSECYGTAPNAA